MARYSITLLAMAALSSLSSVALAGTISARDLVVHTGEQFSQSRLPDTYHLDAEGDFKGFFYAPWFPTDIAIDKAGRVLFGMSDSGLLVRTDTQGGLLDLLPTPVSGVDGVGVAPNGDIFVSDRNLLYRLDANGGFLDLTFSPVEVRDFGIDAAGQVVFLQPPQGFESFYSISFLDPADGSLESSLTPLRSATAIDVDESGTIIVAGSDEFSFGAQSLWRFDASGAPLGEIVGPAGISSLAVFNMPEPGTALLLGSALAALAAGRRAS